MVSTHAPAQGATACGGIVSRQVLHVSTHAPAQGATQALQAAWGGLPAFQPTRPHRARRRCPRGGPRNRSGFNPRARTGRDVSTAGTATTSCSFNPRARTGRDLDPWMTPSPPEWFQPTRPHRARPVTGQGPLFIVDVSTHAPAQGATSHLFQVDRWRAVSTHAPAQGATTRRTARKSPSAEFQPTRPHRARRSWWPRARWPRSSFNPRARTGRDGIFINPRHPSHLPCTSANLLPIDPQHARPSATQEKLPFPSTTCTRANPRRAARSLAVRNARQK